MLTERAQHILNKLYLEEETRKQFFADRLGYLKINLLDSESDKEFFTSLEQEQIEFFAISLYQKRFHAVKQLMPASAKLMQAEFEQQFKNYNTSFVPSGIHKHHVDSIAFCKYLLKETGYDLKTRTMIRFEKLQIQNFVSTPKWIFHLFMYNPILLKKNVLNNQNVSISKKLTLLIFKKGRFYNLFGIRRT